MLLFEFEESNDAARYTALVHQLEHDLETNDIDVDNYTVDDLLDYFEKYQLFWDDGLTDESIRKLIQLPPLNKVIKNIQGDKVVFVGQEEEKPDIQAPKADQKQTVANMAKHALNK